MRSFLFLPVGPEPCGTLSNYGCDVNFVYGRAEIRKRILKSAEAVISGNGTVLFDGDFFQMPHNKPSRQSSKHQTYGLFLTKSLRAHLLRPAGPLGQCSFHNNNNNQWLFLSK